ncbi:MAG: DUF423 domain-containing protein [Betaproteobacteria bacterium]
MEHLQQTTSPRWPKGFIAMGAFMAALSVIASAYASHGNSLIGSSPAMVQASLNLLQFHSIGLILVGVLGQSRPSEKRLLLAGVLFLLGCLMFSINILLRAWHDIQTFKALVPWGGTSFILGWLAFALAYVRKNSQLTQPRASESGDQTH